MADADYYAKNKLLKTEENRAKPSKFYTHFLYKALIVSIFLVIFQLLPSQAPEFINQNLLTGSWELLHLVFVGIVVSYGLFSHRNDGIEKEKNNHSKFDNVQTYVSRFLQLSSVFDEDNETSSSSDENKAQTWSNQYYRNEPVVVVAKEQSVLNQEQRVTSSTRGEEPLLLPVGSLKSRVSDSDIVQPYRESKSLSTFCSNSRLRRFSGNSIKRKNGELRGFDHINSEEKLNENVVLPSPIPWRSRAGRMEMKEVVGSRNPALNSVPTSMEESESNRLESRSLRPQIPRLSRPNSTSSSPKQSPSPSLSSPKKLSHSPSLSLQSKAKNSEDSVRKKSYYHPSPPPPPPPPQMMHKYSSKKPSASSNDDEVSFKKHLQRNLTSERKDSSRGRVNPRMEMEARANPDSLSMRKSVRTFTSSDEEINDGANIRAERRAKEVRAIPIFKTEQLKSESINFMQYPEQNNEAYVDKAVVKTNLKQYPEQNNEAYIDKVTVETDEDSENEEDDYDEFAETPLVSNLGRSSNNEEASVSNGSDGGADVDKKADEFIAKFREQIRLQRIESIKRSSAKISRNSSR